MIVRSSLVQDDGVEINQRTARARLFRSECWVNQGCVTRWFPTLDALIDELTRWRGW